MIKCDLHVHTNFCDGKKSPEEVVKKAIELNMEKLGLLVHSYTFFDESYCVKKELQKQFVDEINFLKEKYADKIQILCGVEQDYYSSEPTDMFDAVLQELKF